MQLNYYQWNYASGLLCVEWDFVDYFPVILWNLTTVSVEKSFPNAVIYIRKWRFLLWILPLFPPLTFPENCVANNIVSNKKEIYVIKILSQIMVPWPIWLKNSIYSLSHFLISFLSPSSGFRPFLAADVWMLPEAWSDRPLNPWPQASNETWCSENWCIPTPGTLSTPEILLFLWDLLAMGSLIEPTFDVTAPFLFHFFERMFATLISLDPNGTRGKGKQHNSSGT